MGTSYIEQENISSFIGLAVALLMYGAALGQFYNYFRSFPRDLFMLKCLVVVMLAISSLQIYSMTAIEWWFLVASHNANPMRASPWQIQANVATSLIVPFIVQSFYGRRLWIISQRNRIVTGLVWLLSFSQFLFGTISSFWTTPASDVIQLPFTGLYSFLGVVCDVFITASVYFYLRPGRSGVVRTETRIQRLTVVTIHMGALTSTVALVVAIDWAIHKGPSGILTPVMIVAQSYVNSLLAILNARKSSSSDLYMGTIEVPMLPTIHLTAEPSSEVPSEVIPESSGRSESLYIG